MTTEKKSRGRPRGTGKNDEPVLAAVADMIVVKPGLRPTTAMKRVFPTARDADIRRLQLKWRDQSARLIDAARSRLEARRAIKQQAAPRHSSGAGFRNYATDWLAQEIEAATRSALEFHESEALRAVREVHESAAMQAIREFHDNAAMRAIREFQDSTAMRTMRELQNSDTLRLIREQQEVLSLMSRK